MLYIASDHAGFKLKQHLTKYIQNHLKLEVFDMGPEKLDKNDDYPDYAASLSKEVVKNEASLGILICGSGHGMCVAANKIKGTRASVIYNIESAEAGKKEDNLNIICLPGRTISPEHAEGIIKKFIETNFAGEERFVRRISKIKDLEK